MIFSISFCRYIPLPPGVDWEQKLNDISNAIEGFSGREIAKLVISWQVIPDRDCCILDLSSCVCPWPNWNEL